MAWGKAGSTTTTGNVANIDVNSMTASNFSQILYHVIGNGGTASTEFRVSSDSGTNYASRESGNGGADGTHTSDTGLPQVQYKANTEFVVSYMCNISGEEKLFLKCTIDQGDAGAGNIPYRRELVGKHVTTAGQITDVEYYDSSGTSIATDSNLSVLGSDLTPAAAIPAIDDVQNNSLFVEKDTARRYWFDAESDITPTDLNTPTWTKSTSDLSQTTDYLQWANMTGGTGNGYYDLGSGSVSDTKWVLRAKLTVSSYSTGTAAHSRWCSLGLSSTSSTMTGTQDSINIILRTNTSSDTIAGTRSNGTGLDGQLGTAGISGVTLGNGTFYLEMIRESGSDYKLYIRSGSHTGTLLGTGEYTDASGVTGLQYIKTGRLYSSVANGNFVAKWEDIEFYNNTTSTITPDTWTMQPTFQDDLSSSTNWGGLSGAFSYDATNDEIDFNADTSGSSSYWNLGSTLSDTAWVMRMKIRLDTMSSSSTNMQNFTIGLSSTNGAYNTTQDSIGMLIRADSAGNKYKSTWGNDTTQNGNTSNFTRTPSAETIYLEITRDSATGFTVRQYSDSDYSTLLESKVVTGVTATGLQYVKLTTYSEASTNNMVGAITDVKIYNGVTSIN